MTRSIPTLPAEIRRRIYHYLRQPCWYLLDKSHLRAKEFDNIERLPMYSEPFTIPDWTISLDVKRNGSQPNYLVAIRAQLALALTCKQLCGEVLSELYSKYTFSVIRDTEILTKMNRFLHMIGPENRRCLRRLEIQGFSPNGGVTKDELLPQLAPKTIVTPSGRIIPSSQILPHLPTLALQARPSNQPGDRKPTPQEMSIVSFLKKYRDSFAFSIKIKIRFNSHNLPAETHNWGYSDNTSFMENRSLLNYLVPRYNSQK